jgi:two-component system sensor histidine kinase ChiS
MTILFSDIRSFTSLTEKMSPEESFVFLNEYLRNIIPAISSNRGFIDKYIGDAIMALFPFAPEDALHAAFDAQAKLQEFNANRIKDGNIPIKIGIGLHTGPLMMGTIGVESRMDSTVISDAVNLASRLESLTKLYGNSLIMSESTMKKLKNPDKYNHRFISKVRVKGKTDFTNIFEFFDGDDKYNKSMKIKTLKEFEWGIKNYYDKQFTKASVHFQQVLDTYPEDITARIFLEHSARYMVKGVSDDWDGIDEVEKVL